jgi:TolA-binding protein
MLPITRLGRLVIALIVVAGTCENLATRAAAQPATPAAPAAKSSPAAVRQYRDAVAFQNRQVYDLAADEWESFLKQFAQDPLALKARHYLGVCKLQLKKYDEGRSQIRVARRNLSRSGPDAIQHGPGRQSRDVRQSG